MEAHELLCLQCRGQGHRLGDCDRTLTAEPELLWMFSYERMTMTFESAWNSEDHKVCDRCRGLDLLGMLNAKPAWRTQSELIRALQDGHPSIQNLGRTGSIEFWADCAVCRCLFAMTLNPSSSEQEVLLFPDWTMSRLAGEDGVAMDSEIKRQSATCLVIVLRPSSLNLPVPIVAHRGDAMCLLEKDIQPSRALGGRRIERSRPGSTSPLSSRVSSRFDFVRSCIEQCAEKHGTACSPVLSRKDLEEVRLLDVYSRKIVPFPKHDVEYVSLSYVWGPITQRSFGTGDELRGEKLPKTIEDAIWFTRHLGKRYLWVDSICINQSNAGDKANQIEKMWSIYRGSVITLLILSGSSAWSGIPGISRGSDYSQFTCCINGKRLVGLMPTLSQQIWLCPWGQRAWTLQEAVLSPRCLYFSDHQMHFECKAMQCCESLEEAKSPCHQLTVAAKPKDESYVMWMAQQMGPGCLRIDSHEGRIEHYGRKLTLYTFRDMTDPTDSLNAFRGVLQKMEELYPKGWYEGLPVEDFDWALLWRHHAPPERRKHFPSWSWAGWKGRIWHGQPIDVTKPRRLPVPLVVSKSKAGRLASVFESDIENSPTSSEICIQILNDPVHRSWSQGCLGPSYTRIDHAIAERDRYIFVEAIVFHLALDFSKPLHWRKTPGEEAVFSVMISNTECRLLIMAMDKEIKHQPRSEIRSLVLIARDHTKGMIINYLLLVRSLSDGSTMERVTTLRLVVPLDGLEILEELRPERKQVVIA